MRYKCFVGAVRQIARRFFICCSIYLSTIYFIVSLGVAYLGFGFRWFDCVFYYGLMFYLDSIVLNFRNPFFADGLAFGEMKHRGLLLKRMSEFTSYGATLHSVYLAADTKLHVRLIFFLLEVVSLASFLRPFTLKQLSLIKVLRYVSVSSLVKNILSVLKVESKCLVLGEF